MTPQEEFESFWPLVWRKVGKGAARKAYIKARKIASHDVLCSSAKAFTEKLKREGTEERFQPHPSTWLNAERWTDEAIAVKGKIISDTERAINRALLAVKGIKTNDFEPRIDAMIALRAGKITQEEAARIGFNPQP